MAGKAQHPADQNGVVAGILHAFAGAFEDRQRIGQRRRSQFGRDQRDAVQTDVRRAAPAAPTRRDAPYPEW